MMKKIACSAFFVIAAAAAQAQATGTFTITCAGNTLFQTIAAGREVGTFTCTSTAQVNGVPVKQVTFSSYTERAATEVHVWGVFVATLENGDQVNADYQTLAPARGGVARSGTLTYKLVGGSGIAKGIAGSGTCAITVPAPDSSIDACTGAYAIP